MAQDLRNCSHQILLSLHISPIMILRCPKHPKKKNPTPQIHVQCDTDDPMLFFTLVTSSIPQAARVVATKKKARVPIRPVMPVTTNRDMVTFSGKYSFAQITYLRYRRDALLAARSAPPRAVIALDTAAVLGEFVRSPGQF